MKKSPLANVGNEFISELVENFYARVRQDPDLGPIFAAVVAGDWAPHLAKMKSFWAAVILRTGGFKGRPVPAHLALRGLRPAHFQTWLRLFEETLVDLTPDPEVARHFMSKANLIAHSLQMAIWGPTGKPTKSLRVL